MLKKKKTELPKKCINISLEHRSASIFFIVNEQTAKAISFNIESVYCAGAHIHRNFFVFLSFVRSFVRRSGFCMYAFVCVFVCVRTNRHYYQNRLWDICVWTYDWLEHSSSQKKVAHWVRPERTAQRYRCHCRCVLSLRGLKQTPVFNNNNHIQISSSGSSSHSRNNHTNWTQYTYIFGWLRTIARAQIPPNRRWRK